MKDTGGRAVFFLSFGLWGHDGRQHELLKSIETLGPVTLAAPILSREYNSTERDLYAVRSRDSRNSISAYFGFLLYAIRLARKNRRPDVFFVDDFTACLVGLIILPILRPRFLVQDSREFYYSRKMPGMGRIFVLAERLLYRFADIIVCANEERATLMKVLYGLSKRPIVFENIRVLAPSVSPDAEIKRILDQVPAGTTKLISTGGVSRERGTMRLIIAMEGLPDCHLFILGRGGKDDFEEATSLINSLHLNNVTIIERISYEKLPDFLSSCDIGIVEYHQNDLNNIFCASGKVYEYLSVGLPIVCTPNISLAAFCSRYRVGVASGDLRQAIKYVASHQRGFRENVIGFSSGLDIDVHRSKLSSLIQGAISEPKIG